MLHTAHRDGRDVWITIPKEMGQAGVDQLTNLLEMLDGYRVKPTPATVDKVTRAEPFSVQVSNGRVACMASCYELVKRELGQFPDAPHDDLVDALSDAYAHLAIPDDPDEISKRQSIAALRRAGEYVVGEGLSRVVNPDAPQVREGYLPGEGEI